MCVAASAIHTYCAALVYVYCFYRNTGQTGTIADTGPPDAECGLATGPPGLQAIGWLLYRASKLQRFYAEHQNY